MTILPAAITEPTVLTVMGLGRDVLLLAWDGRAATRGSRLKVFTDDEPVRLPTAHASIPTNCGWRSLVVVSAPETPPTRLTVRDTSGQVVAEAGGAYGAVAVDAFDPFTVSVDTDSVGRSRLSRFLLEVCRTTFRLSDDGVFGENCRRLIGELAPKPGQVVARCHLADRWVLCEGVVPATGLAGHLSGVVLVGGVLRRLSTSPARLPGAAARPGCDALAVLVERAVAESGGLIVLFTNQGYAVRQLAGRGHDLPSAVDWLRDDPQRLTPHRHFLFEALLDQADGDGTIAALLREVTLRVPRPPARAFAADDALSASVDVVVAGPFGTFVAGDLEDGHALADAVVVARQDKSERLPVTSLVRFARAPNPPAPAASLAALSLAVPRRPSGFAGLFTLADASGLAPCTIALGLRSGETLRLTEGPSALSVAAARAAVLAIAAAIGPDPRVLSATVAPVIAALSHRLLEERRDPVILDVGTPPKRPIASLIVPFDDDPARLRCRLALSVIDPTMAEVEMVLVLGAAHPGLAVAAERQLSDLHGVFGVACRLVVVEETLSPAAVRNLSVRASTAPVLVFADGEALPSVGGWLPRLVDFLKAKSERGVVGGQRVFDDHSIVDAGYDVTLADDGLTVVRPRLAGFPRDFRPAALPTMVDAVSAGCLAVRRSLFERFGGFNEDYLAADHADAEFCLRVRQSGLEVWRTAEATLLQTPTTAVRARPPSVIADALDRIIFDQRWRSLIEARSPAAEAGPATRPPRDRRARPASPKAA